MPDHTATAHHHLSSARAVLLEEIAALDVDEVRLRDELDVLLGERTIRTATLVDLDQLLDRLSVPPAPVWPTAVAEPTPEPAPIAPPAKKQQVGAGPAAPTVGKPAGDTAPDRDAFYAEVAHNIIGCPEGVPVSEHLATIYDRPVSTVRNWVHTCRKLGLLPASTRANRNKPAPPAAPPQPDTTSARSRSRAAGREGRRAQAVRVQGPQGPRLHRVLIRVRHHRLPGTERPHTRLPQPPTDPRREDPRRLHPHHGRLT